MKDGISWWHCVCLCQYTILSNEHGLMIATSGIGSGINTHRISKFTCSFNSRLKDRKRNGALAMKNVTSTNRIDKYYLTLPHTHSHSSVLLSLPTIYSPNFQVTMRMKSQSFIRKFDYTIWWWLICITMKFPMPFCCRPYVYYCWFNSFIHSFIRSGTWFLINQKFTFTVQFVLYHFNSPHV